MAQKGFLLVLMQPPAKIEEEFNAWYDTEHVPERLSVPGVLTAIRFASVSAATPKYLAMYDLETESVLDSDAYKRVAGSNSSPWTRRVTGKTKVYRSVGNQIYPGNAITSRSARVTLLRFRGLEACASDSVACGPCSKGAPRRCSCASLAIMSAARSISWALSLRRCRRRLTSMQNCLASMRTRSTCSTPTRRCDGTAPIFQRTRFYTTPFSRNAAMAQAS
jgi:hypothetical protein